MHITVPQSYYYVLTASNTHYIHPNLMLYPHPMVTQAKRHIILIQDSAVYCHHMLAIKPPRTRQQALTPPSIPAWIFTLFLVSLLLLCFKQQS
jgi:hypothetical protein